MCIEIFPKISGQHQNKRIFFIKTQENSPEFFSANFYRSGQNCAIVYFFKKIMIKIVINM